MNPTRSTLPRAGHNPGHLRNAFVEAVETNDLNAIRKSAGMLWLCTDVMPGYLCDSLNLSRGSTYARAARTICSRT